MDSKKVKFEEEKPTLEQNLKNITFNEEYIYKIVPK